jgi:hypothetical protein
MSKLALRGMSQNVYLIGVGVGLVGGGIAGWKLFGLIPRAREDMGLKIIGAGLGAFGGMIGAIALVAALEK